MNVVNWVGSNIEAENQIFKKQLKWNFMQSRFTENITIYNEATTIITSPSTFVSKDHVDNMLQEIFSESDIGFEQHK